MAKAFPIWWELCPPFFFAGSQPFTRHTKALIFYIWAIWITNITRAEQSPDDVLCQLVFVSNMASNRASGYCYPIDRI